MTATIQLPYTVGEGVALFLSQGMRKPALPAIVTPALRGIPFLCMVRAVPKPKARPFCPAFLDYTQSWVADAYRAVQASRNAAVRDAVAQKVEAAWQAKTIKQSAMLNAEGFKALQYETRVNAMRETPTLSFMDSVRLAKFEANASEATRLDVNMIYCKKSGQPYGRRTEESIISLMNEYGVHEAHKLGEFIALASGVAPGWESLSPETLERKRKYDPRGYYCYAVGTLVRKGWQTRKNNKLFWETTPYITFHNSLVRLWHLTADIPALRLETLNARLALWLQVLGSAPENYGETAKHWMKLPDDFLALAPHFFANEDMQKFIEKEIEKRALEIQRDITNRLNGKITGPITDLAALAPLLRESRYLLNSHEYDRGTLKQKAQRLMALEGLKIKPWRVMKDGSIKGAALTMPKFAVQVTPTNIYAASALKGEAVTPKPAAEMKPVSLGFTISTLNAKKG